MSKKKKKKQPKTMIEIYQSIRRDWGSFNPVTRVIGNKKKKKPKYPHKIEE